MIGILKYCFLHVREVQQIFSVWVGRIGGILNDMVLFPNKYKWAIRVRNLLNNTGFSIVWQNEGKANEIAFLTLLQQRLQDMFIQDWHLRLDFSSRASLYHNLSSF